MDKKDDFKKQDIEQDTNDKEKTDDELMDFIKNLEEATGENIELKDINIKKDPSSFFKQWFVKSIIETILIYIALFGFISLFDVFSYDKIAFVFIYLAVPSVLYFISCMIIYSFRKRLVFIFNNIILSVLLMFYIIVSAILFPYVLLNNFYLIFLVSLIVGISKTLILRSLQKLRK